MDKREKEILSNSILIFSISKIHVSKPFLRNAYSKGPKWEHQARGKECTVTHIFHNMFRNQHDYNKPVK